MNQLDILRRNSTPEQLKALRQQFPEQMAALEEADKLVARVINVSEGLARQLNGVSYVRTGELLTIRNDVNTRNGGRIVAVKCEGGIVEHHYLMPGQATIVRHPLLSHERNEHTFYVSKPECGIQHKDAMEDAKPFNPTEWSSYLDSAPIE